MKSIIRESPNFVSKHHLVRFCELEAFETHGAVAQQKSISIAEAKYPLRRKPQGR